MSDAAASLELHALACERGARLLFSDLSLRIDGGAGLRITGANGSGKTSLLRIVAGLGYELRGGVSWGGQCIRELGYRYREALLYIGHAVGVKAALTPEENLSWWLALHRRATGGIQSSPATAIPDALGRFGLAAEIDTPCARLSAGQQRRVALARLCLSTHPLWVLDEPATALDRDGCSLLEALFNAHLGRGGILLLTTHQPLAVEGMAELDLDQLPVAHSA